MDGKAGAETREQSMGAGWCQVRLANTYTWMAWITQPEVHGICWLIKVGSYENALVDPGDAHSPHVDSRNPILRHFNLCYLGNGSHSFDYE